MKYLALALCLFLASCDGSSSSKKVEKDNMPWDLKASHFDYNGHQYIMFRCGEDFRTQSVVHDPDCFHCKHQ